MLARPLASVRLEPDATVAAPVSVLQAMLRPATGWPDALRTSTTRGCVPLAPGGPDWPLPDTRIIALEPSEVVMKVTSATDRGSLALKAFSEGVAE